MRKEDGVVDPLGWWPGKYTDCKKIAQFVEEFLPRGEVLEAGGPGIFETLLPSHQVTTARIANGIDLLDLPYADDTFDVAVSARVVEFLPPAARGVYLREILRVCRYRAFVALPLQPELEAIDKIKNAYLWDTSRVWQHPGLRPQELENLIEGFGVCVAFHVEDPTRGELARVQPARQMLEALIASPALVIPGVTTPGFVVAEIAKSSLPVEVFSASAH